MQDFSKVRSRTAEGGRFREAKRETKALLSERGTESRLLRGGGREENRAFPEGKAALKAWIMFKDAGEAYGRAEGTLPPKETEASPQDEVSVSQVWRLF